jgi:signal transduction histidine kinase
LAAQTQLEVELEVDLAYENGEAEARHVEEIESTIYRLVQEGLNNVVKHAGATRAHVTVIDRDGTVRIEVRDDGEGFDPQTRSSGFGLLGMRERLALVAGTLDVDSTPGAGTVVRATIPSRRRDAHTPVRVS